MYSLRVYTDVCWNVYTYIYYIYTLDWLLIGCSDFVKFQICVCEYPIGFDRSWRRLIYVHFFSSFVNIQVYILCVCVFLYTRKTEHTPMYTYFCAHIYFQSALIDFVLIFFSLSFPPSFSHSLSLSLSLNLFFLPLSLLLLSFSISVSLTHTLSLSLWVFTHWHVRELIYTYTYMNFKDFWWI